MPKFEIEFTNDTLVATEQGVQRLADILRRPVAKCLWAIKWLYGDTPNGISFHKSHRLAKEFARVQMDSNPVGPARLVDVSDFIYEFVSNNGYCWTDLNCFSEAATYEGITWKH